MVLIGTGDVEPKGDGSTTRGQAQLWDLATGLPIGPTLEFRDEVRDVAFSPDGSTFCTASYHGPAQVWETPSPIQGSKAHIDEVVRSLTRLQFDNDDLIRPVLPETDGKLSAPSPMPVRKR
jgi:WD40 repeat protein